MIVIFDIPERERRKRNQLRRELVYLGFKKLQQSVWIGQTQIPEEFIKELKEKDILPYIHIFSVEKKGTVMLEKR